MSELGTPPRTPVPQEVLGAAWIRQYRAALAMARAAVERCPDRLWTDPVPTNAFWQVAYHAVYFTHLYLHPSVHDFVPWEGHVAEVQHPDGIAGRTDPDDPRPLLPPPYPRDAVLAYAAHLDAEVPALVRKLDLASPESGFPWYRISKLEHQLVNLRHLQHHAAQLADRIRAATGEGVSWTSSVDRPHEASADPGDAPPT